jgi:hypothetical protein
MTIYSKEQEILCSKPASLDGKVTMRIGGMHLLMALLPVLENDKEMVAYPYC